MFNSIVFLIETMLHCLCLRIYSFVPDMLVQVNNLILCDYCAVMFDYAQL